MKMIMPGSSRFRILPGAIPCLRCSEALGMRTASLLIETMPPLYDGGMSSPWPQWRYRFAWYEGKSAEDLGNRISPVVNQLGEEGWEMLNTSVSLSPASGGLRYVMMCAFKRPVAPP